MGVRIFKIGQQWRMGEGNKMTKSFKLFFSKTF